MTSAKVFVVLNHFTLESSIGGLDLIIRCLRLRISKYVSHTLSSVPFEDLRINNIFNAIISHKF